jgi:hypothetical protein
LFWSRANGSSKEKLGLFFDMYDLNQSQYIDFHELHSIVKVLLKLKYSVEESPDSKREKGQTLKESYVTTDASKSNDIQLLKNYGHITYNSSLPPSYHIGLYFFGLKSYSYSQSRFKIKFSLLTINIAMSIMKKFDLDRNAKLSKVKCSSLLI